MDTIPFFSKSLHSLRGIAALIVVLYHVSRTFNPAGANLFAGSAAVSFFFVLSGLVLGQSLATKRFVQEFGAYIVRRIFRLIPLCALTALLGGFYVRYLDPQMFFNFDSDPTPLTLSKWLSGMIGISLRPNGPSWSIFVELIGSALVPLFMLIPNKRILHFLVGSLILALSFVDLGFRHNFNFYFFNFFAGVMILRFGLPICDLLDRLGVRVFWISLSLLFLIFYSADFLLKRPQYFLGDPRANIVEVFTVAPIIAGIFFRPNRFSLLEHKCLLFLGEISFSIYLTHYILLELTSNTMIWFLPSLRSSPNGLGVANAFLLLLVIIPVSWLSYHWIERQGVFLGKLMAMRISLRRSIP